METLERSSDNLAPQSRKKILQKLNRYYCLYHKELNKIDQKLKRLAKQEDVLKVFRHRKPGSRTHPLVS